MLKQLGRLEREDVLEIENILSKIYDDIKLKNKKDAEKQLIAVSKTPNYFIREEIGKLLAQYHEQKEVEPILKKMLKNKFYGVRATGLFYFYNKYIKEPNKIISVLENTYKNVPWESESIINELWRSYPKIMKEKMIEWVKSKDEKKRAISFHGMENIAKDDPAFIMEFIAHAIDDNSLEVQKKITHILTQVARLRPAECYPYVREWLVNSNETRTKTIWVSMKKLVNLVVQKGRKDKSQDFIMLTNQTINDWKSDDNKNVSSMGRKLSQIT